MAEINLFGEMQQELKPANKFVSEYQKWKARNNYRDAVDKKSCKSCEHRLRVHYHDKIYHKCNLMGVSSSEATDIRLKKVCDLFEEENG